MSNIKRNLSFQTCYQILITVTPLITAPYLARVLGAELQGLYSYRLSIVNYFTLAAVLGMTTYGTKVIAEHSKDRDQRNIAFAHMAIVQIAVSLLVTALYLIYCLLFASDDLVSWVLMLTMISYVFDFNWFFFGIQKFDVTTGINSIAKILNVVLILALVKSKQDFFIYAIIMSATTFLSFALLIPFIINEIKSTKLTFPTLTQAKVHLKESVILFVPILAQTIYHVMDKTMLGAISNYTQTGYYYNADKLVCIPIGVVSGICTVMLPKMVELKVSGDKTKTIETFKTIIQVLMCLSSAFCFGIISISESFVPFFYGEEYIPCISLVNALAFVIVLKSLSEGVKTQYLIPNSHNKCFIISVSSGAAINLILNVILIPSMGAMGAVIGTLFAEITALLIQILFVWGKERMFSESFYLIGFLLSGFIMWIVLSLLPVSQMGYVNQLIIKVVTGIIIYAALILVYSVITPQKELSRMLLNIMKGKKGGKSKL